MKAGDKILVAPLDWGLGHASRCVPVIDFFLEQKLEVIIGGSGSSLEYLKQRFPALQFVELPSAKLSYGRKGMVSLPFFGSMCRFACNVSREHSALEKIVRQYGIGYVFSDNRLGLYSKKARTIYITHQLNFDNGFLCRFPAWMMKRLHRHYIDRYDSCCVPDVAGEKSLSGILSENNLNVKYLGPLSRFKEQSSLTPLCEREDSACGAYDLLILSGIEPQRSILEKIFIDKYSAMQDRKLIIVRGLLETDDELAVPANITYENNPSDSRIANLMLCADRIFCRSGYSTLCDLAALKRRAVLIPTPRQPEQEYLAQRFSSEFAFPAYQQHLLANMDFAAISYDRLWDCNYAANLNALME